jgi:hypothetical protein
VFSSCHVPATELLHMSVWYLTHHSADSILTALSLHWSDRLIFPIVIKQIQKLHLPQ